jgi:predicted metal-dependent RNase
MSQIDYSLMSDDELRQFFLQNRQDRTVFEAYMDRLNQRPRKIIASPGDPNFEQKIQAAIQQKLEALENKHPTNNKKLE